MNNEVNKKHLTYLRVENFKAFEAFELEDIGQFNLITGENHIGKTTILEALLFDDNTKTFGENLYTALIYRFQFAPSSTNYLAYFQNKNTEKPITFSFLKDKKITLKNSQDPKSSPENAPISLRIAHKTDKIYLKPTSTLRDIPLVYYANVYENNITELYSKHIQNKRPLKRQLISVLRLLVPNLEYLEVSTTFTDYPLLVATQSDMDAVIPLAMLGHSVIKLTRIWIEIVVNSEKRLMIDEIDTFFPSEKLTEFWQIIIRTCEEHKVQLFATVSHSESLESYAKLLDTPEMLELRKNARIFELEKTEEGKTQINSYYLAPNNSEVTEEQEISENS